MPVKPFRYCASPSRVAVGCTQRVHATLQGVWPADTRRLQDAWQARRAFFAEAFLYRTMPM